MEVPIYQREELVRGQQFSGPAIIEQLDTTTVVEPGDRARVDFCGNLIIEIGKQQ
jgi:N-methylhydantoinase A